MSVTLTVSAERCRVNGWELKSVDNNGLGDLASMSESKECRGVSASALGTLFDLLFAAGTWREEGLRCFLAERDVEYLYAGWEVESRNPSAS